MHPYFNRRAPQSADARSWSITSANVVALNATRPATTCPQGSPRTSDAARCAVAVRGALGHRLTAAQSRTLSIMEACGALHATRYAPGQVVAFQKRDRREEFDSRART